MRHSYAAAWLLITVTALAQEKQAEPQPEQPAQGEALNFRMKEQIEAEYIEALDREVTRLRTFVALEDGAVARLRVAVRPLIRAESQKIAAGARASFGTGRRLTTKMADGLAVHVGQIVADKAGLQAYQKDRESRDKFHRDAAVLGFVHSVDTTVSLHSVQIPKVRKLAEDLWAAEQLPGVFGLNLGAVISEAEPGLRKILTPVQFKYWKENGSRTRIGIALAVEEQPESRKRRRGKLVEALNAAASLETEWLSKECGIDAGQLKRLNLAAKGAINGVVDRRLDAEDQVQRAFRMEFPEPDPRLVQLAGLPVPALFRQKSRWPMFVEKMLTAAQRDKYSAALARRAGRERKVMGRFLPLALSGGAGSSAPILLTGEQLRDFSALVLESIPENASMQDQTPVAFFGLLEIADERFVAAMGQKNFQAFRPLLDQLRAARKKKRESEAD